MFLNNILLVWILPWIPLSIYFTKIKIPVTFFSLYIGFFSFLQSQFSNSRNFSDTNLSWIHMDNIIASLGRNYEITIKSNDSTNLPTFLSYLVILDHVTSSRQRRRQNKAALEIREVYRSVGTGAGRNANNNSRLPRAYEPRSDFQASFQPGNDSACPSRMFVLEQPQCARCPSCSLATVQSPLRPWWWRRRYLPPPPITHPGW